MRVAATLPVLANLSRSSSSPIAVWDDDDGRLVAGTGIYVGSPPVV
jgi:hypothetical protein